MDRQGTPPEEPQGTDSAPEPLPGAPEMSDAPITPKEFHEQLQQRPQQDDEQPRPFYEQPPAPQYRPLQYSQPDYNDIPSPPPPAPQQQDISGDYGPPPSQPMYDAPTRPPQPVQYGSGDYRPDQPAQYGGSDYRLPQQPPQEGYYTSGPPPGPIMPAGKKGRPAWVWATPLALLILVGSGVGAWMVMSTQQKTTSVSNSEATVVAMRTAMAVARATITTEAAASATAQDIAFATIIAGLDATATAWARDVVPTLPPDLTEPVRMPVEEFIALYEDPAKRPIIVDVRSSAAYEEGHIAGAVSIPDDETESRLNELPKDRLIVAYCQ